MFRTLLVLSAFIMGFTTPAVAGHRHADAVRGAVFVATNSIDQEEVIVGDELIQEGEVVGNEVVMFNMAKNGALRLYGRFPTGGQGSGPGNRFRGDALGSGNSIQLSRDQKWLLVTNAGDDSVSVLKVDRKGLTLVDNVPSGGFFPNSVAVHKNLVYVLNSGNNENEPGGEDGNITGFRLGHDGKLRRIPGSTRELNSNGVPGEAPDALVNPTQVSFTPDGRQLVVTIKDGPPAGVAPGLPQVGPEVPTGPGRILVYKVNRRNGQANLQHITTSDNRGPFAFNIDRKRRLYVADFIGGGAPDFTGAATSYKINRNGTLTPISVAVDNDQIDTCWVALGGGGKFLYGANFGTNNISSYAVGRNGSLTLLEAIAAKTGAAPPSSNIDIAASRDGKFLYNVLPGRGTIAGWEIKRDGKLDALGEFPGLQPHPAVLDFPFGPVFEPFGPGGSPAGIAIADFRGRDDDDDDDD